MSEITVGNFTSKELKIVWQIENFSSIEADTGNPVYSPEFNTLSSSNRKLQWRLRMYPNGDQDKDYISIYLQNMNNFVSGVTFSVSILNDTHKEIFKLSSTYRDLENTVIKALKTVGWHQFAKKSLIFDTKNRTLINDTLTISCSIFSVNTYLDGDEITKEIRAALKYNEQLFETGNYSDVKFSMEGKEMRLHKNIVASLSPVFEAMFMNDMNECKDNLVTITDIKYDVMKELFRYIYTRRLQSFENMDSYLLIAADKYAIAGLKIICEISLGTSLKEENALQRLQLAVMYNASYLKPKVVEFVANRLKTFVVKDEFKELTHDCKDEIFNALANKISIE